jgi:RNA polymerase sigma-70 factor (ECF subfamily)
LTLRAHSRALFETEALPCMPALYNFALALAGASDAEDLVQTTCVRALEKFDSYRPGTNMRAWLFTILRNEWVSRHRRAQRWSRLDVHPDEEEAVELADEAADLEAALMDRRWSAEIKAAMQALPDGYRLPVYLKDVEGFGYREIAEIAGCPIGTVMSRLARGRAMLRETLVQQARERGILRPHADASDSDGM